MSAPGQSVFVSYAREDLAAARRIADALSAFEVEVWFDEAGLEGGDAWDQKIRRQIKACSLFIPIISTQTQARREAYFRLEWKLAEERTHLMAEGTAFLLPIAIDDTMEAGALVPESFQRVQWTRLPRGVPNTGFVDRVRALLEMQGRSPGSPAAAPAESAPARGYFRGWWLAGEVLLGAALVAFAFWPKTPTATAAPRPAVGLEAAVADKSIAVLPFINMSEDKANAFFADGVHEEILTDLANIGELKVIARTSVVQYRDTTKTVRQIAAELGVTYILEGSVRRSGNKVRVTGQLIKASTEAHLWAKNYDGDLTDVFALQSKLAEEIATALQAVISPRERSRLDNRPTQNTAAYDLYLKGREQFRVETNVRDSVARIEPLFAKAVELDPGFALAWLYLARVHFRAYNSFDRSSLRQQQAKKCIDTAMRLAPEDPMVILGLGNYWEIVNDLSRARTLYQQVAGNFPNNSEAVVYLSYVDRKEGRWAEALSGLRKAMLLDPRSVDVLGHFDRLLFQLRHFEEIAQHRQLWTELSTANGLLDRYYNAILSYYAHGSGEAMDALVARVTPAERRTDSNAIIVCARWAYTTGNAADFIRLWEEAGPNWRFGIAQGRYDQMAVAAAFLKLGQPARARPLLEQNRDQLTAQLAAEPKDMAKWSDLALVQAMLGDKAAVREILSARPAVLKREDEVAAIYAWLGDKELALAKLTALLRRPSTENINVNILRHYIGWWPLQGDPRFEALLNDPENNAPLL